MTHSSLIRLFRRLVLVILVGTVSASDARAEESTATKTELYDYVIQDGDTCAGIASRLFGNRKAYKIIHRHNKMGPLPHRLKAGRVLRLPTASREADAILEARFGKVEYRKATEALWGAASTGMDIFRAWRVWSHQRSTAVLVFRDDSVLSLRDDTIVVIYGPTAAQGKRQLVRAELEGGSLRSRLAALEGGLLVDTASSSIELDQGSAVISASRESQRSTLSNHEGGSAKIRKRSKKRRRRNKAVAVGAGQGTWVEAGKDPAPPRDLPAAPVLLPSPPVQIALASQGTLLTGKWEPVAGAARYRVEVATDPKVRLVVAAFEVASEVHSFEASGLSPGRYFISVAAIDDQSLESTPSARQRIDTALLEAVIPEGTEPGTLAQGTLLKAAEGLRCTANKSVPSADVGLLEAGSVTLRCTDAEGNQSNAIELQVKSTIVGLATSEGNASLERGQSREFLLRANPAIAADAKLRVTAGRNLRAELLSIDETGIRLRVKAEEGTATWASVDIYRETAAGEFQISSLDVSITDAPVAPAIAPLPFFSRFYVSALSGFIESRLERASFDHNKAPMLGLRATFDVANKLEIEAETYFSKRFGDDTQVITSNQLLMGWREQVSQSVALRARVGAVLWHTSDPIRSRTSQLGATLGLSMQGDLGPGALRLDLNTFAAGGATYRLATSLSYQMRVDLLAD